ncbi:MAG: DegT/DnrJ/EryC1/StrS family aminotransferase [Candidatus Gastranaerophilales bacterium]|nr:DegT/DnrJ/EryC1/StrS family aminotransferase [Candidatus Gastranaerophilales bacterium]
MIPLVDLKAQYKTIREEVLEKIEEVIESCAFIQGKYVQEFEDSFAKIQEAEYALGCSNGTSAISLVLESLGIKQGDEVITTTHTFIATAEAVCNVGAKPVFVDINPETYNIDISKIESTITDKTKAIIPVHIYGNPVNMEEIMKIAKKYNLIVIEDCAQAHLAKFNGKFVGTFGNAGTFSFFPGKNLGAYGDAGGIITDSLQLKEKAKKLLNHGRSKKYEHESIGYNQRMDGLQAAILNVKLKYIKQWTKQRQENARLYNTLLSDNTKIILPKTTLSAEHVYHLYVIQVNNRNQVMQQLNDKGIAASIHYPIPLHLQPAFKFLGYKKGDFPVSENITNRILSLPMFPELSKEQIEYISNAINSI